MKKSYLLLIALIIVTAILLLNDKKSNVKQELRDFAIEDTSSISKIFLADKFGNDITLTRTEKGWVVNDKYSPREDAIKTLLSTIKSIEVNYPVSNSMHNNVIKNLASKAVKIEIFLNDGKKPNKTYYIGSPGPNMIGSFMLLENSSKAFVMYIPGFNGFLAPRYNIDGASINLDLWRDRSFVKLNPKKINSIEIINHDDSTKNYKITKEQESFILQQQESKQNISSEFSNKYFNLFRKVNCEGFMNNFSKKDSIINSKPFHTIKINSQENEVIEFNTFHKSPKRDEYLDMNGLKLSYDQDRFFAHVNDDLLLIQFYTFNQLLLNPNLIPVEK
ncbi:MAG: DUF4340 domain-containing protein [Flavobacteriales bacterium]|jgi:hypothetical protein|tara:strand:+ start:21188 stop:22186 length:999 start_codon:yes stop_codon:yes gene_type:complete